MGRIVLGSVSEAVIHHSHWPVLVLRGGEDSWPPERVIFGDDGSEAARAAGDLGRLFAGTTARVPWCYTPTRGCRRWTPKAEGSTRGSWTMSFGERRGPSWSSRELELRLGSRPKVRLVVGDAAASLLEAAEEDAPERTLVAVGSRDLGAIGRMRLGSVSTKVVHAAGVPSSSTRLCAARHKRRG